MIRIILPIHLRTLAGVNREVAIQVDSPVTIGTVLDGLEKEYPVLRGTIRDQISMQRRPFIRFFACGQDFSLDGLGAPLPEPVLKGEEPLRIVGAMAGG